MSVISNWTGDGTGVIVEVGVVVGRVAVGDGVALGVGVTVLAVETDSDEVSGSAAMVWVEGVVGGSNA